MKDKELLENAAKAYWGEEIDDVCSIRWLEDECGIGYTHGDNQDHNGIDREFLWNPLTEDGDALRLAVKLRISLIHEQEYIGGQVIETIEATGPRREDFSHHCEMRSLNCEGDDEMASTRRAIVLAAAAMAND